MARLTVLQVVCLLLMVSPCGCDDMLGILADGDKLSAEPIKPGLKDTSPAVPLLQRDPALEPPLPTQISAPAAKHGDRGIAPVRPQISKDGSYQQYQQGISGLSQDIQAYPSPNSIHNSDENQAGTSMPSKGLLSKSVKNLDLGNYTRQKPDKKAETTPFLNNLGAVNTLGSTRRTNTDVPDSDAADTTTESSAVKEAETTKEIINKEQYRPHEDGYKADDSLTNNDKPDVGVLSSSADQFPASQVNKEAPQNQSSGGQALNSTSEDNVRNQYAKAEYAGMLDSFVGPVSQSHSTAETEHKTEIQSHSTAVYSSDRDHAGLNSSDNDPNMALIPGVPDNRPSLPEDVRPNVSHSVSNNTVSPSAERPAVPAENVSLEKGITGDAGSTTVGTQQSSSDHPHPASEEDEDDFPHGTYDKDNYEDDWWYFNPDNTNRKEDKVEFSSSLWFLPSTPQPAEGEAKDADDKKESTVLPDIPEKVKVEDVVEKMISGPKDSIVLYTVLIVIFITGIVSFSLWKNASKKSRPRNSMSMMPTGEEGKRLLDHPFV